MKPWRKSFRLLAFIGVAGLAAEFANEDVVTWKWALSLACAWVGANWGWSDE